MRKLTLGTAVAMGLAVAAINLMTPRPAEAFIHEIIAALCRSVDEEVVPPGQVRVGQSFVRALFATGFITGVTETSTAVTIHFDPTIPASKFKSAGQDLVIPGGNGDGRDLILSPEVIPDPDFAAHSNCHNYPRS